MNPEPIVIWGTYDTGKPRTRILCTALKRLFSQVSECHVDVWGGVEDKSQVHSGAARLRLLARWLCAYPVLVVRYLTAPAHRIVVIPYMGTLDILVLYPFAKLRRAKICLDIFISLYDTTVIDRQLVDADSLIARCLFRLERLAIRLADISLIDTHEHQRYLQQLFSLPANSLQRVWVGAEAQIFPRRQLSDVAVQTRATKRIVFYGQFIPLHGIDTIVAAAELMEHAGIDHYQWVLIGQGQMQPHIDAMIRDKQLSTVTRIDWVPYPELVNHLHQADICLGIFNNTGKSLRVIPNKVFQILCAGVPLITADSPAIRELLQPGQWLKLNPPGDPAALVEALISIGEALDSSTANASDMPIVDSAIVAQQLDRALRDGLLERHSATEQHCSPP